MSENNKSGHRDRLRERFVSCEQGSQDDLALLELLLTYAIPLKDVQPLAKSLIAEFGSLDGVLAADIDSLVMIDGIKQYSAVLIKLVDALRKQHPVPSQQVPSRSSLFEHIDQEPHYSGVPSEQPKAPRQRSGVIGKAILKEAIAILPKLPDTESLAEIRQFLVNNLHFSAAQTRKRNSSYITLRMFPNGIADKALIAFARKFQGTQELRDVCFYRFCMAEPLMLDVIAELIIPAIGFGKMHRQRIHDYLIERFPESKSIGDCSKAIVDALAAGGIVRADRTHISFSYRDIPIHSFAFVIHSEYSEPGMYDLGKLEKNIHITSMLWNPTRLVPMLYELRNSELISKISEIDNVRQFTTKWTLDEMVVRITS